MRARMWSMKWATTEGRKLRCTCSTRVPARRDRHEKRTTSSYILARFVGRRARETVEGGFFENIQREDSEESNWGLSVRCPSDSYLTFPRTLWETTG